MTHIVDYNGKKIHVYDEGHFISNRLDSGEGWEQDQIDYIKSEFSREKSPKAVMVDIGGDIGTYSIFLADSFDCVYCFEPNLSHYELIVKSIDLNDIKNVHVKHVACSDER